MRLSHPLRRWLALRFASVAVLPLVIIALLIWLLLLPQIRSDVESHHKMLAYSIAGQVEAYLSGAQRELKAITRIFQNRGQQPATFWFGLLDAHVDVGDVFDAIYIVNATDRVYAIGLPKTHHHQREDFLGLDLSRRQFLRKARTQGIPIWSEVFLSAIGGRLTVALALPIPNDPRVIVAEIAIDPLSKLIDYPARKLDCLTLILDHRGQVIADSQQTLSGQQLSLAHLPIVRDALHNMFQTEVFEFNNTMLVGTTINVPQVGWTVLVAQPRTEVFRPVSPTLWAMMAGLVIALLLATATGQILARSLARRINGYINKAHIIADGDYDQVWKTCNIEEFTALAHSLQRMSDAIHEREQALVASETRLRVLSSMASDWFWEQDEQFRFSYFSLGTSGESPQDSMGMEFLLGKTRWELPITNLTPEQWAAHRSVLDAHQPFRDFEYQIRPESGEEHWFNVNGEPRFDTDGRFIGYLGTGRNITDRKRAEARQRLQAAVFEAAREAIIVTDAGGKIVAVNPAFVELSGYSEAEVTGRDPRFLQSNRQSRAFYTTLWRTVLREGAWQGEFWGRHRDGNAHPLLTTIGAVRDVNNQPTYYVGLATDITHQKDVEQRIEHLAYYDALTDLPNRTLLARRSELALALAKRRQESVAVLFMDLDRFKEVNDSLGHAQGDTLLVQAATRLKMLTRKADTICRLGGDEFVLLLSDVDQSGVLQIVYKLQAAFRQPFLVANHHLQVTTSIGIALYPNDGEDFTELLKNADIALYQAKQNGRNTWALYNRDLTSSPP